MPRRLRNLLGLVALALVSGCYTVNLSETTYPEDRVALRSGPGAAQGELVRLVRLEYTHYTGERVSFGLMPGIPCMAHDFGGWGFMPALSVELFIAPFVNACALGTPTLCTLLVEPFVMTDYGRGTGWDSIALGFLGAYRWRTQPNDKVEVDKSEDVLVDGGYCTDTSAIEVTKSDDGTKRWNAYPGFRALWRDVEKDGKVDVLFPGGKAVRRFRKAKHNDGCLAFEDLATAN